VYISWYLEHKIDIEDSVGLDEVGRGPLAGPVVSAVAWISSDLALTLEKNITNFPIRDSKKMSPKQRNKFMNWLGNQDSSSIRYAIGSSSVDEIDDINILNAAMLSMSRAYNALGKHTAVALVDGNVAPNLANNTDASNNPLVIPVIKGDNKVLSIAIASIIAKEYRDSLMRKLAEEYPQYYWYSNVGYGSRAHLQALYKFGVTPHHRRSFAPISKIVKDTEKEISWDLGYAQRHC
jgi:ribonuclease HII